MTRSTATRGCVAVLAAVVTVGVLSGCDPVAWARKTPQERASESRAAAAQAQTQTSTPTAGATSTAATDPACGADAELSSRLAALRQTSPSRPSDRSGFDSVIDAAHGRVVRLGPSTVRFADFLSNGSTIDGGELDPPAAGLVGAGVGKTVLEVLPGSSTKARAIPSTFPDTNQIDVLKVSGSAAVLHDFTVRGTEQGHLYNGLRVSRVQGLLASDVEVVGIPGDDKQPPGETFAINDFRTVGSLWSRITVDGAGVGGSGFATNSSRDVTVCDTVSRNNTAAMGFAFWQTENIRLVDCTAIDNGFSGFNFERVSGAVTLVRPTASGNRYGMRIASDRGSAKYTIVDPTLTDGHWTVTLPKRWYGTANRQRVDDISLMVGGRERPDLLRIVRY